LGIGRVQVARWRESAPANNVIPMWSGWPSIRALRCTSTRPRPRG
jgi:hypothetical protein